MKLPDLKVVATHGFFGVPALTFIRNAKGSGIVAKFEGPRESDPMRVLSDLGLVGLGSNSVQMVLLPRIREHLEMAGWKQVY